ncbi:bifunctional riboflavin kinase/FAD synthetase [Candidatus Venteria ishoeyi]|uniref:bifunctional riboflavin kinase/FAD synthetase n=1 Tax=Candidatus Venteria ishoeyi TaxID=1899563 RepID=UPI0025A4DA30|nr:bifunctional riboflavin kinase/FAD synthetase [Candidatus Venteria ishoeyi]MDM8545940.1 bifunctional riboflavin kinase/FAD synthetase [Candidatus Venteria ishoeyi]
MEVIRSLAQLRTRHQGCVATIGNFDGVHLGHQSVFRDLKIEAKRLQLPSVVISFEPQPQEFFTPEKAPPRLTRLREKVLALRHFALDRMLCLRFNQYLAGLEPNDFIHQVIMEGLGVKYLIVGDDFRFGYRRAGDFSLLQTVGEHHGFQVHAMKTFLLDGERVSSTRVRQAMTTSNMAEVHRLLGRYYTLCGRIAHGRALGRTLNFPTANICLHRKVSPLRGVFAVRVKGLQTQALPGVANIGYRPTVENSDVKPLLEVHLFDFNQDIYGAYVEVEIIEQLRDEVKFDSLDALQAQISIDVEQARSLLLG